MEAVLTNSTHCKLDAVCHRSLHELITTCNWACHFCDCFFVALAESEVEKGEEAEEVAPAEGEEGDGEPKEKEDDEEILDQGKDDGAPTEGELQEGGEMVAVEGGEETTEEKGEDTEEQMKEEGEGDEKPESPLPQSDTFQDGDRPETPTVQVPEPLSREGSPKEEPQHLDAGTPEIEGKEGFTSFFWGGGDLKV